jgi:ferredoxin
MDAIVGMEGEGPGPTGKPKKIGALIVGTDAIAVDFISVNLVGLDHKKVRTITSGKSRRLGEASFDTIEVIGEKLQDLKIDDFVPTRSGITSNLVRWPFTSNLFKNMFLEKPFPSKDLCSLCYKCKKICSAGAISKAAENKNIPVYDYNKCIRCFCCMEICPEGAISIKKGILLWLLERKSK